MSKIKKIFKISKKKALSILETESNEDISHISKKIKEGYLVIFKEFFDKKKILQIIRYLKNIGKNSLPEYQAVNVGAANSHRVLNNDPRSIVKGIFHQFSFYHWNQDPLNLFVFFNKGYYLKNLISGLKKDEFFQSHLNYKEIVPRISFQFYPSGSGYLSEHSDPVGQHQISAPLVIMSKKHYKGDFATGGSYMYLEKKKIILEDICDVGDFVMYDSSLPHGVEIIDKKRKTNWLSFKGRWTAVLATNKVNKSKVIPDAKQLK